MCQGTLWKLYAQDHVASCNGCSHESNHIEIDCSFSFLDIIIRVEGCVNSLYDNIHNCMFNVELQRVNFCKFVQPYTACLLCIWCSLHASSSHRANLFSQHMTLCCESFHSLVLHVLRCTVNDHHHYHSSVVCESTSGDSTPTILRGCVLLCNIIGYYVIAMLHPWVQSISHIIYHHIVAYET